MARDGMGTAASGDALPERSGKTSPSRAAKTEKAVKLRKATRTAVGGSQYLSCMTALQL